MNTDEFRVGDTVYCLNYGKGVVKYIGNSFYPVKVEFFNGKSSFTRGYTLDGRYVSDENRVLFFEEIKIPESAYKRPRWRAEKGNEYFFINDWGDIKFISENKTAYDDRRFNRGNYFPSEEEAKESKFYKVFHEEEL